MVKPVFFHSNRDTHQEFTRYGQLLPWGTLGYAEVSANQLAINGSNVDLTGLSVEVKVGSNRRVKVTGHGLFQKVTNAGSVWGMVQEGATVLGRFYQHDGMAVDEMDLGDGSVVLASPSEGSHTYKLTVSTTTADVNLVAGSEFKAFILVEDIGPA